MKICYVINNINTEKCGTTITLMAKTHEMGHEVHVMSVGDFIFRHDAPLSLHTIRIPEKSKIDSPQHLLEQLQAGEFKPKKVNATDLDVLFIRNNPTEEGSERHWAEQAGVAFGRMMQNQGVLVLNDAYALSFAFIDKLYFEELPPSIKPASIITRNKNDILEFYEKQNKKMVLKPLEGSGGKDVFLIDEHEKNLNQIIDTISQQGYVIAQEFLPDVKHGDVRILLLNGRILEEEGQKAIIRRVSSDDEFRSNFSLGATADSSDLTDAMKNIVNLTAPKLIRDGLFLVGLDIVKDKLIEINVLSPGGLERFSDIGLPDFTTTIVKAIERKLYYKKMYSGQLSNRVLATMH